MRLERRQATPSVLVVFSALFSTTTMWRQTSPLASLNERVGMTMPESRPFFRCQTYVEPSATSVGRDGAASDFPLAGPWVDVAAPGEAVVSLHPDADGLIDLLAAGKPISGTSYAAPVVAGIAALVRARFPQLDKSTLWRNANVA